MPSSALVTEDVGASAGSAHHHTADADGASTGPAVSPATATRVLTSPPPPPQPQSELPLDLATPPRTRSLLTSLVVAALALSGWAMWRGVEEHTLSGTVLLTDSQYLDLEPGRPCTGHSGYDDLAGGAQVVLADGGGEILSTGRLSAGEFDGFGCAFSFELEDVPRAEFYGLSVGGGSRGELQYAYDELAGDNWFVQLSIGDFS